MSDKQNRTWLTALWDDGDFEREAAECADAELRRLNEVNQAKEHHGEFARHK